MWRSFCFIISIFHLLVLSLFISKYFSSVHYPYSPCFFTMGALPGICQTIRLYSPGLFTSLLHLLSLCSGAELTVVLSTVVSILLLNLSLCFTVCMCVCIPTTKVGSKEVEGLSKYCYNKLLVYILYTYSKCLHVLV